jgi:hypothetical protein
VQAGIGSTPTASTSLLLTLVVGNAGKTILNQAASLAFNSPSAHSSVRYKGEWNA